MWMNKPRTRISDDRVHGQGQKWCGRYGWIEPSVPMAHAAAAKHCGDVFVHATDVEKGQTLVEGMEVDFIVYLDGDGLGAEQCRQVALPMLKGIVEEDAPVSTTVTVTDAPPDGS